MKKLDKDSGFHFQDSKTTKFGWKKTYSKTLR